MYYKRDDFLFHIVKFPIFDVDVILALAYGICVYQLRVMLQKLGSRFVFVPAEKAVNNVVVVRRRSN